MRTNLNPQLHAATRLRHLAIFLLLWSACAGGAAAQNAAPKDKPIQANKDQAQKVDDAIAPYVKKARETLPDAKVKYLAGLAEGETFFVSIKLYDPDKKFELVFVRVTSWKDDVIEGVEASDWSF